MKKLLIITLLFITALTKSFAQSGDLEVVGIDPSIPKISLNGTSELILVINQNGPQDLPTGSARVNISINPAILNWVLPITLTDDCGGLWTVQTANPTATTTQIQLRNNAPFPFLGGCTVRIPVKGIALGTGSVNVTSTVFGTGVSDPNGTNQGANTEIIVVAPPVATNDNAGSTSVPIAITVLTNDTPGSAPIDPTKVMLIDPVSGLPSTNVTIPGEGNYTVNTTTGVVTFTPDPALTTPKTSTIKYTITDTDGQTSNQATITVNATPLPVTLTVFKVTKEGKIARLNWETTEETNSDHFEIQHSITGKDWNKIGTVYSHGDSKVRNVYSFNDANPANGDNLYRLKMIDRDATYAYSRIQSARFDGLNSTAVNVYPNPSTDRVFVQDMNLAQVKQASILDMNGHALFSTNKVTADGINVSKFNPGTYVLQIKNINGTVSNHKIVIAK